MVRIGKIIFQEFPLLLAPMEDISDPPFRAVCKTQGADLMYSEFISSEGLIRHAEKSKKKLDIFENERPIGIQIFGGEEFAMSTAAKIVLEAKPDLLDINFGCPVKKVVNKGAGAGVLKNIDLIHSITHTVVESCSQVPVTVKTRLGWDNHNINIMEVVERLQSCGIAALTIHARTRSQMYTGKANWEWIKRVKENAHIKIPIFGNGDIDSPQKALEYRQKYLVDGIMIGRAAIGYPWIFREIKHYFKTGKLLSPPSITERCAVIKQHLQKSIEWKGEKLGVLEMRKHYVNYFKGLPNIKIFKNKLITEQNPAIIEQILSDMEKYYN
ncbi:MAG: tRNA dihydrouridine synthase DusB [Chitinophagaceae bacterium]